MACAAALVADAGCGDNATGRTVLGPPVELPLLVSRDPATPFNHSAEVTIAARNGRVVVACDQLHLVSETTYRHEGDTVPRRVAVMVSDDGGRTFSRAIDPVPSAGLSSDPVVRATRDGTMYLSVLALDVPFSSMIARSYDGRAWTPMAYPASGDKEWLAIDELGAQLYLGEFGGYWRYGLDGALLGRVDAGDMGRQMSDGYADASGVHFATFESGAPVGAAIVTWTGDSKQVPQIVADLDPGAEATTFTVAAWSIGPLDGGTWAVHARCAAGGCPLVLRVDQGGQVDETILTSPDATAFLPTAELDDAGLLHVAWYDSAGPSGVLYYTHSRGPAPFADGFVAPIVIDANATPGDRWYPDTDQDSGARRLREYIDLAVDGDAVHVAWTHSPSPPSRVYTRTIRVE